MQSVAPEPPPRSSLRPRSALLPPSVAVPSPRSSSLPQTSSQKVTRKPGEADPKSSATGGSPRAIVSRREPPVTSSLTKTSLTRKPAPPMTSVSNASKSPISPDVVVSSRARTISTTKITLASSPSKSQHSSSTTALRTRTISTSQNATSPSNSSPTGGLAPPPRSRTTSTSTTASAASASTSRTSSTTASTPRSRTTTLPTPPPAPTIPTGLSPAPRSRTVPSSTSTTTRSRTASSSNAPPASPPAARARTASSAAPPTLIPIPRVSATPATSSARVSLAASSSPASPSPASTVSPARVRKHSTGMGGAHPAPTATVASPPTRTAKAPARSISASASAGNLRDTGSTTKSSANTSARTGAPSRSISASASVPSFSPLSSPPLRPPRASPSPSQSPTAHVQAFASAREAIRKGRERSGVSSPAKSPVVASPLSAPSPTAGGVGDGEKAREQQEIQGKAQSKEKSRPNGKDAEKKLQMAAIMAKAIVEEYEYDWAAVSSTGEESQSDMEKGRGRAETRQAPKITAPALGNGDVQELHSGGQGRTLSIRTRSQSRDKDPPPPSPVESTLLSPPSRSPKESRPRSPSARPKSATTSPISPLTARPRSPPIPPKSPSRTPSASRSRERVPFPQEVIPAVPSPSTSSLVSGHDSRDRVAATSDVTANHAQSPATNAHIPLAMQTRPRNMSDDPRTAAVLVTAAARAPGSPPQRTQSLAQAQAVASPPSQRTPERSMTETLERKSSLRINENPLALDMKRLLSKPVEIRPRVDSSDGTSTGGESEGVIHLRRKRYDASGRRVERVSEDAAQRSRGTRSEDGVATGKERDHVEDKKAREVARAFMGPLMGAHSGGEEKERRKNVLKRRPSANRPSTAPASTPPSPSLAPPVAPGPPVLSLNLSLKPMNLSDGDFPRSPASGKLTPAGQVAQAYKRGLTPSPSASPLPSPSIEYKRKALSDNGHGTTTPSPPATPYYTVFGSTSGRVVAVGGPEDSWDGAGSYISATAFPGLDLSSRTTKISTGSATVGRSLTRKVSERWGRKREENSEDDRGRSSTQIERRGKRSGSRSAADEAYSPAGEADWTMSSSEGVPFNNEPRSRRSEPALGGGNKIWKLMKRISTGGLKEKYERGARNLPPIPPLPPMPDLPPVPRLPKDLPTRSTMSSDGHADETGAFSRFMQSRSSLNAPQPAAGISRPSARALPMPPPIPASQPRASTTTRSSSPMSSSDVASSKYFPKTTSSTRSSTSSYGEEPNSVPPPLPDVPSLVGKHIVPPKELSKLDVNVLARRSLDEKKVSSKPMAFFGAQNVRGADDWTIVNTPAEEKPPSLPHPPRRLPAPSAHSEGSSRRLSETPSIPEFSTKAPINAFAARKPPASVAEPLPVPAPRRSTDDSTFGRRLGTQASGSVPSASASVSARTQQRSASLPRAVPEKLTFRNMSEKGTVTLTDKEKADRWDDLLERSERAGGTIHLGSSQPLASDEVSVRYSTCSTQLLKDF